MFWYFLCREIFSEDIWQAWPYPSQGLITISQFSILHFAPHPSCEINQNYLSFHSNDTIKYPTRIELASRTTPTISIQFTLSSTGFCDKFIFSIRQSSMPTSRTSMGSCIWRWTLLSFWSSLQCIVSLLRTRGNMMNARSTSKHFKEAQIWKPWEGEIPHEKNSWMLKFSLTCRLTCRIIYVHSNIVKLCPNKTSPVFNVDHDTELLNFYSYIGEVSCCMKMCCHIFAAPAVSTHYVVFDSFFWWKKCASMWCMSALWVGWWTFGSCLVIFGLISFWPTLGIFGERQSSVIPITPSQWALTKSAMGSFLKEKVPFNIGQK